MICPACGTFEARIYRTMLGTNVNRREQRCRCGIGWQLIERMDPKSVRHWAQGETKGEMPLGARNGDAVKRAVEVPRDISSLSDPSRIPESDPNPKASESPKRARARRGRPSGAEYTPDFLVFWDAITIHRGNKKPAFTAWVKIEGEMPAVDFIIARYNRWAQTTQWLDGYPPYVATWINARGWETEPEPHEFKKRNGVSKFEPPAVRAEREREERILAEQEARLFGNGR